MAGIHIYSSWIQRLCTVAGKTGGFFS